MAVRKALVIGALSAVEIGAAGAVDYLAIGPAGIQSSSAAWEIGVQGDTIHFLGTSGTTGMVEIHGDLKVDGDETVVGDTTFQLDATFEGNVTFGNAASDKITFVSGVDSDIEFFAQAAGGGNRHVSVRQSGAGLAATDVVLQGGKGGVGSNDVGGDVLLVPGAPEGTATAYGSILFGNSAAGVGSASAYQLIANDGQAIPAGIRWNPVGAQWEYRVDGTATWNPLTGAGGVLPAGVNTYDHLEWNGSAWVPNTDLPLSNAGLPLAPRLLGVVASAADADGKGLTVYAGDGGVASVTGGGVGGSTIFRAGFGGDASGALAAGTGGATVVRGGGGGLGSAGATAGQGGTLGLYGGAGGDDGGSGDLAGSGGVVEIIGGSGGADGVGDGAAGGDVKIVGGTPSGIAAGGGVQITGADAESSPGAIDIVAGTAAGTKTSDNGANVLVRAGAANAGTGGSVAIEAGAGGNGLGSIYVADKYTDTVFFGSSIAGNMVQINFRPFGLAYQNGVRVVSDLVFADAGEGTRTIGIQQAGAGNDCGPLALRGGQGYDDNAAATNGGSVGIYAGQGGSTFGGAGASGTGGDLTLAAGPAGFMGGTGDGGSGGNLILSAQDGTSAGAGGGGNGGIGGSLTLAIGKGGAGDGAGTAGADGYGAFGNDGMADVPLFFVGTALSPVNPATSPGFRLDSTGKMEYKDVGGSWTPFTAGGGSLPASTSYQILQGKTPTDGTWVPSDDLTLPNTAPRTINVQDVAAGFGVPLTIAGGLTSANGAPATSGGQLTLAGGAATGASGLRLGGAAVLIGGNGVSGFGSVYLGTNPALGAGNKSANTVNIGPSTTDGQSQISVDVQSGYIYIYGGQTGTTGATVDIRGGRASNEYAGGALDLTGGRGGASAGAAAGGDGGLVAVTGGLGGAGDATFPAGAGGWTSITGGSAGTAAAGGGASGGDVRVSGGAASGAGTNGSIRLGYQDTVSVSFGDPVAPSYVQIDFLPNTQAAAPLWPNAGGTRANSDLVFTKQTTGAEPQRYVAVETAASGGGGALSVVAGDAASGNGGALTLAGGGGAAGNGGGVSVLGGRAATTEGYNGGLVSMGAADGSDGVAGAGGGGGSASMGAGNGGNGATGQNGGTAGGIGFVSGVGGDSDSQTAGDGGSYSLSVGGGGDTDTGTAGAGGSFSMYLGSGGAAATSGAGGNGGSAVIGAGTGGASDTGTAGDAGTIEIVSGSGGAVTGAGTNKAGGYLRLTSGDAGTGPTDVAGGNVDISAGAGNGTGAGGSITLNPGNAGTGETGSVIVGRAAHARTYLLFTGTPDATPTQNDGPGFRMNNTGKMQFCDAGGAWTDFASGGGSLPSSTLNQVLRGTNPGWAAADDILLANTGDREIRVAQSAADTVGRNLIVFGGAAGPSATAPRTGGVTGVWGGTGSAATGTGVNGGTGGTAGVIGGTGGAGSGADTPGAGGNVQVAGGDAGAVGAGAGAAGGDMTVRGGTGTGAAAGGRAYVKGGPGGPNGDGGDVRVDGGAKGGGGTNNGKVVLGDSSTSVVQFGGGASTLIDFDGFGSRVIDAMGFTEAGGLIYVDTSTTGTGQLLKLQGADGLVAVATHDGGPVEIVAGAGGAVGVGSQPGGDGGHLWAYAGRGGNGTVTIPAGSGGPLEVKGGDSGTDAGGGLGNGGLVLIQGGYGDSGGGASVNGGSGVTDGGDVYLQGGSASGGTGGDAFLRAGAGTSTNGGVYIGDQNSLFVEVGPSPNNWRFTSATALLSFQGNGNINLPNHSGAQFQIEGSAVSLNFSATNANKLVDNQDATGLHYHSGGAGAASMIKTAASAVNFVAGDVVAVIYVGGDSSTRAVLADADDNGDNRHFAQGIAAAAATGGNPVTIITSGEVSVPNTNWDTAPGTADVNKPCYLSTTAGHLTLTPPGTSGDWVHRVGFVTQENISGTTKINVALGDPTQRA